MDLFLLQERWGTTAVVSRGRSLDASKLPALVAEAGSAGVERGARHLLHRRRRVRAGDY